MLSYCLHTVNSSVEHKKPGYTPGDERLYAPLIPSSSSASASGDGGEIRRGWKEEEVVANQLANEETVEAIIRKRSLDGKTSLPEIPVYLAELSVQDTLSVLCTSLSVGLERMVGPSR